MTLEEQTSSAVCPLCGANEARVLYSFRPAIHIPGDVVRCSECGLVYKVPARDAKPISEYYDKAYAGLNYWDQDEAAGKTFDTIIKAIELKCADQRGALLDVGCGPGQFMELARRSGFNVAGVDMSPELADRAHSLTGADVTTGDFMTVDYGAKKFDVITLLDLIEHVPDPIKLLRRCSEMLSDDGLLVVFTPNHDGLTTRIAHLLYRVTGGRLHRPVDEIFDCLHLVFFGPSTMRRALAKAGFGGGEVVFLKYEAERSMQARGLVAKALSMIELLSVFLCGPFRMLVTARKLGD